MEFVGLFLEKGGKPPLYAQLYEFLACELREGRIHAGEKLPGKRTAAAQLGISVNTVDEAYQLLAAEGYVEARPRSGFVASRMPQLAPAPATPQKPFLPKAPPRPWQYSFLSGGINTALFPSKSWNRLFREVLAGEEDLFATGESQGDAVLRCALEAYLRAFRGVRCTAGQIVVGAGLEVLLSLLAPLLPKGPVAVENPGYAKTAKVFQNAGKATVAVDVDIDGLQPKRLQLGAAGTAYLTPSHQFPSGCTMPAPRRVALLSWAAQTGGILIEDDYDSEFRFDGHPLPSLQGMDSHDRVVYAGTFSRSLAPGIRAAYLVLPPALLAAWQQAYGGYACTIWRPEQHTLARFLSEGHFARRQSRMRTAYRQKRNEVLAVLVNGLPPKAFELRSTHTGLYFLLRLPGQNARQLAEGARCAGLGLRALAEYSQGDTGSFGLWGGGKDILLIGYGGLPEGEVAAATKVLLKTIKRVKTPL